MNRKGAFGVWSFLGILFVMLGVCFLAVDACLWVALKGNSVGWILGLVFAGIGLVFVLLGVAFFIIDYRARRRRQRIREQGRYVMGEITAVRPNYQIELNGRNPFFAVVRCQDAYGKVTMLRSENRRDLWFRDDLVGRQVRVYIEDESMRHYVVDLEPLL